MTAIEKKAKEFESFVAFQRNCPECPHSIPIQPEPPAPDIFFPDCDLGIELTEYSLGQGKDGSLPRQYETVHQRIAEAAKAEYESKLNRHLQVSVLWTIFTKCPMIREEKIIAQAIAEMVASKTSQQLQVCRAESDEFNEPLIKKYGIELSIFHIPGEGVSCWSSMVCFGFPSEAGRIQAALDEKESKVAEYRKTCRAAWLLITADRNFFSSGFSFEPKLSQITFNSSFDRAFLIDEPQNSVYEFKTSRN
jgi:hypothetical protein